jgi:aryl-alcohol dehydrogenase-like predicted oxidoreductase
MQDTGNRFCPKFADRDWHALGILQDVARELRRSPAQVAINWVTHQPQVASTLIGATSVSQLGDLLAALEFRIPDEHMKRLDECSRPESLYPYTFLTPEQKKTLAGGLQVNEAILAR